MILDARIIGLGIGLGKITIDENLAGVKNVLQAVNEASFGRGELDGIRRSDFGVGDFVGLAHSFI